MANIKRGYFVGSSRSFFVYLRSFRLHGPGPAYWEMPYLQVTIYLSIYLSISIYLSYPSIHPYIHIYLSLYLYIFLSIHINPSINLYIYLSIFLSIYMFVFISIYVPLYLSICLIYIYISINPSSIWMERFASGSRIYCGQIATPDPQILLRKILG